MIAKIENNSGSNPNYLYVEYTNIIGGENEMEES